MDNSALPNFKEWEFLVMANDEQSSTGNSTALVNGLYILFKGTFENMIKEDIVGDLSSQSELPDVLFTRIPGILRELNILTRPFSGVCHSCIISEQEVNSINTSLLNKEMSKDSEIGREMFFMLPNLLKQVGLELYRPAEQLFVNDKMAEKLARAIHSRYSKLMLDIKESPEAKKLYTDLYIVDDKSQQYFRKGFDDLPESVRLSNIDNAYHIPTKLLAIGYGIRAHKGDEDIPLLYLSDDDVETMAMVEHDRWSWEKRLNGFRYAPIRNDAQKKHNCLVPYDKLNELEKEKDRVLVRLIPSLLQDIGFIPYALNPDLTTTLKYSQRALAKIHHVKRKAESLRKEIEQFFCERNIDLPSEINDNLNDIIEGSREVASSVSSAGTIQKTYLPSTLFFRECLPDSFLLFKPRDIVSGDFYFVSKKFGAVVFIAADCTGHGIQGAMLSAICYNYIDQAVNDKNITDPAAIIATVMPRVEYLMRRNEGNVENKSGMELAVCTYYPNSNLLFYAGLNRPLYYYSNNQLNELEPTKYRESIEQVTKTIQTQILKMNPGDTAYLFSDGFADQFGGERDNGGERFKTKRFKELLGNIQDKTMVEQREALNQTIEQWRQQAKQEQTDDIIVIGVKL